MKNRYTLFFALLAGTVLILFANVFVQKRMDAIVKEDKLVDENFAAEGTPPLVAFPPIWNPASTRTVFAPIRAA